MYVRVYVYVHVYVCMDVCMHGCVRVCVCVAERDIDHTVTCGYRHIETYTHTHTLHSMRMLAGVSVKVTDKRRGIKKSKEERLQSFVVNSGMKR